MLQTPVVPSVGTMSTPTPWPLHVVPESWCKERHYFEAYNAYQAALECPEDRVLRKRAKVTYRAWRDFEVRMLLSWAFARPPQS
jgi:hypothetical protein